MATKNEKNENPVVVDPFTETVPIMLPLDRHNKDDVFVGVNGRTWQIKRGVRVEVPLAVQKVLENSERMQQIAMEYEARAAQELDNLERGIVK